MSEIDERVSDERLAETLAWLSGNPMRLSYDTNEWLYAALTELQERRRAAPPPAVEPQAEATTPIPWPGRTFCEIAERNVTKLAETLKGANASAASDAGLALRTLLAAIALSPVSGAPAVEPQADGVRGNWNDDWTKAPRDGTWTDLLMHTGRVLTLRWSDHYSVFGLGGCWTDGLCTMGDKIDFTHWRPSPIADAIYAAADYVRGGRHTDPFHKGQQRVETKLKAALSALSPGSGEVSK